MKNIHILPTDKPSRLYLTTHEYIFEEGYSLSTDECENKHIYITSDEVPKLDEWGVNLANNVLFKDKGFTPDEYDKKYCRKIILTTDQDLIKDGVQAIDDTFLEWFVTNPSCDEVEIFHQDVYSMGKWDRRYKIIIPKEDFDFDELHYKETFESRQYYIPKEEPKPLKKITMKNIHVIPTDKPSRLVYNSTTKKLDLYSVNVYSSQCKNIYITNNEEIKEGDYYLYCNQVNKRIGKNPKAEYPYPNYQKIILTDNQELIKDGVQAIDDEFLEWFVKNPSCEMLKIDSYKTIFHSWIYKIIIPKELKQECECTDECLGYLTKECKRVEELNRLDDIEIEEMSNDWETMSKQTLPKQETLEEAMEKYPLINQRIGFKLGAKWFQEQLCNSEIIQRIRATKSDAEARRIIKSI
jgi:hypothetical protein